MNVAKEILQRAYAAGFQIEVDEGEGARTYYPDLPGAWEMISNLEEASVYITVGYTDQGNPCREMMLVLPDLDEDDTVADCTAGGWIDHLHQELIR